MARYTGPVERIERRLGVSLELKGERRLAGKSALDKRPYAPGQHGQRNCHGFIGLIPSLALIFAILPSSSME
jgi:hypothetical protein